MSDPHNENEQDLAFYLIENPIVSNAQSVKLIFAFNLFDSRRVRILGQGINALFDPSPYRSVEGFEISFRSRCELNPVRQLDAQLFLDLLPGHGALLFCFRKSRSRLFEIQLVF